MATTTSILSFDVGIRHLAFCHMTHAGWKADATCKVLQWDVIDLGPVKSVEMCASRLMEELDKRFAGTTVDVVLVERQPKSRSIIMVAVQMFLCSYFSLAKLHGRVKDVRFISAQRKLAMRHLPQGVQDQLESASNKYSANKKYAILVTRHYLTEVLIDYANLVMLDMYPKKDDLCDSLLQGLAFIESGGKCSKLPYQPKRKYCTN